MALDLFVNFERSSNSSMFYRVTSVAPVTFTVKLSDLTMSDENPSSLYYAESALNNGTFSAFIFNGSIEFDTISPCICSISVNVSSIETNELINGFVLSGVFLSSIPAVDFVAYPDKYIDETTKTFVNLNSINYSTSPGVRFYGEGHTEGINLSASGITNDNSANWFVGNLIYQISDGTSVLSAATITPSTAYVSVSTIPFDESIYPISLWSTNSNITTAGPFITYNDSTGEAEFYSFFNSTLNVEGLENSGNTNTKQSITVLQYPEATPAVLTSPFINLNFTLPLDYSLQTFRGITTNPSPTGILTETFIGTQWELNADSSIESTVPDWVTQTSLLSTVFAYQFQLSYDKTSNEIYLPDFTASPIVPTTVSLLVSSYKDVRIGLASDWISKRVSSEHSATAVIEPFPFAKIYTPNYYNIKGESVLFNIVDSPDAPIELKSLVITSPYSLDTLVLSGASLSGTMQFNKIGVVDLSATAVLDNTTSGSSQTVSVIFLNMLEVINKYDDVEEDYFQTALTPLKLTYGYQPRLTPNEWAIADNVNSIIEKIYTTIDDLDDYTKLYERKDKFYGWLGLKNKQTRTVTIPTYVWMDLECPDPATEDIATWAQFECSTPITTKAWEYHECDGAQSDPTCLQKYCLEWKWKTRKCETSDVKVSWKSARCGATYAKKWLFEKCEIDSEPLNCDRDSWKISTIDPESFPIPSCSQVSRCKIVDVEVSEQTNQTVIAYATEINLIDTDYNAFYVARRGVADDLFSFQNIVGLTINSQGKVIVLDDTLPRVCVYKISDNKFNLFSTWGSYGFATNPRGFNKPQDIHVDASNSVWIADTGNNCIKKLTITGKHLMTITHEKLDASAPLSVCVDSKLNVHCLTEKGVYVFDSTGTYSFEYTLPIDVTGVKKINTSYNREMIYITYANGVIKYFRTGIISHYTIQDLECSDKQIIQNYNSISQDKFRNVYVTAVDKILKISDLQKIVESKAALPVDLYWSLNDLLIHKEEYIQPWVYLKSFHRLWDNIELFRNSLFYNLEGCKSYTKPTYMKNDLIIGQNEIVTNAVINRLAEQLWINLQGLINYFDPNCEN